MYSIALCNSEQYWYVKHIFIIYRKRVVLYILCNQSLLYLNTNGLFYHDVSLRLVTDIDVKRRWKYFRFVFWNCGFASAMAYSLSTFWGNSYGTISLLSTNVYSFSNYISSLWSFLFFISLVILYKKPQHIASLITLNSANYSK